jgi:O-acetylserine/cysteine efflux transporter
VGQIFPSYSLFPIFGIGLSFLIFGEIPTFLFLIGSAIVLTSVFLLHKTS